MPKVIVYIAMSLDGYIAAPGDDLSFLSMVEKEGEDYGYGVFMEQIATVIMGRKTYDWVMKHVETFPHANLPTYILTRQNLPPIGNITFYNQNLSDLLKRLKAQEGKNIFVDGGAQTVQALLKENLIDEFILSIIPVLLGSGIRLFDADYSIQNLKLIQSNSYESGLVQLHYTK
jgi:dihydrofolate reductase